ncbi:toxin TcdB middle/N-terminal domain-containing protein [Alteromonas sp. A081]|uniref:toxin TcdB middle/N-terminal domain-containing protein n=1 Tax=Alteromonas sp. A081 TaxID=3410269 RepID=UPI003B97E0EF
MKVKSGTYGAPDTNYYLESDDFSHAKAMGGNSVNGPRWFVVWKKSGELLYYGDIRDDTTMGNVIFGTDGFVTAEGAPTSRANTWMLKAIRDRKGNYIRFTYIKEYGTAFISKVEYSGHLGQQLPPFASINFNYSSKNYYAAGYNNGGYSMSRRVLTSIVSKVDDLDYRAYILNYDENQRRVLSSVRECPTLSSAEADCLESTLFNWTLPNTSTAVDYGNINTYITGDADNRHEAQVFDLTGDGKSDLLFVKSGYWRVKSATSASTTTLTNIGDSNSQRQYALNIDFNGDGVRDLLVADGQDKNWYVVYYENTQSAPSLCEGSNECPAHFVNRSLRQGYIKSSTGSFLRAWGFDGGAAVMDVNGDGFEDIVYRKNHEVRAYINTGNKSFTDNHLYTFSSELSGDAIFGNAQMYRATIKSASAIDINGDGLSDVILQVTSTDGYCVNSSGNRLPAQTSGECERDLFGTWRENTTSNRQVFISKTNSANDPYFSKVQTLSASYKDIRYADLNGDGLTDMVYSYANKWRYRLSNGKMFGSEQLLSQPYDIDSANFSHFVDVNYDGKADMLYATSNSSWHIYISSLSASPSKVDFTYVRTRNFGANNTIRFGDGNGDGNLDLYIGSSGDWRRYSVRPYQYEYTVNKITNGFGVETNIQYAPMTDTALYFRQDSSYNTHTNVFSPIAGGKLVSEVRTAVTNNSDLAVKYQYGGLLLHRKGRGSLGFEVLKTIDQQTGVITETYNHQYHGNTNFVMTGIPRVTAQFKDAQLLSWAKNNLKAVKTAQGGYYAYVYDSFEKGYTYDGSNSQFVSQTNTRTIQDTWGNVDSISVTVIDKDSNNFSDTYGDYQKTYSVNTYKDRRWGRLETTKVEKTVNGVDKITRNSKFTYNSTNYLHQAIVSPDDAKYRTTTTYIYDTYGNKTEVSVEGYSSNTGNAQTRTSKTEYQGNGRFVHRQHDAMGNYVTYQYNGVYGNAVSGLIKNSTLYSVNSQQTKTFYDVFGQVNKIEHPDSRVTTITRSWCLNCVPGSHYYEAQVESGKPAVRVYFDKWGREVAKYVRSAADDWDKVFTYYDEQGRVDYVTEPTSSSYRTTYLYNAIGQVEQVTRPNGEVVSYYVNGLEQSTVDERGNTYLKYADGFGRTTKTIDPLGGVVTFTYDAYGNLKETLTEADGKSSKIQNWYDAYGRKTKMVDPEKGIWEYTYNAFGELFTQKTGRGHTFTFNYDKLGRKVRSYEVNEGTLCWHYATNTSANRNEKKAGKLFATAKYNAKDQACGATPATSATLRKHYGYDSKGRPNETQTYVGGNTYFQNTSYDEFSRADTLTYPADSQGLRLSVQMHYSSTGDLYKITNKQTGALLKQIVEFDRRRQAREVRYGNNVRSYFDYRGDTGWQTSILVKRATSDIFYSQVSHDEMGNVDTRTTEYGSNPGVGTKFTETYSYDDLNRLDYRSVSVADWGSNMPSMFDDSIDYQYDGFGNLKKKNGVSTYNYSDANRVHRLTSATGFGSFAYDNNGNIRSDGTGRAFHYGTYDKPTRITKGALYADMKYGINRELYFKKEKRVEEGKTNEYQTIYLGNYEEVKKTGGSGSLTEHKYYVAGDIVISHRSNGTKEYSYLHKDHQGSITTVTNVNGTVVQQAFFDPFGKRTQIHQASVFANASYMQPTDRGYTGHKMMDGLGIIHMNGRIYDPTLGRFLQADPHIQAPSNSQSYNRYSYVLNNPLSYTDPSGYFFSKLWKGIKKFASVIIVAVASYYCAGTCTAAMWAAIGGAAGATGAALNGGNILTGALVGAFTGGIGAAAGQGLGAFFANGIAGGIASKVQGGKFGHGFWSAGLGSAIGGGYGKSFGKVVTAAVVGGTISKLTGGKFANGAVSAAFMAAIHVGTPEARKPTEQEVTYAKLANDVYDPQGNAIDGYEMSGDLFVDPDSGLQSALYVNQDTGHSVLAFAGTNGASDWIANIRQAFGLESAQYTQAMVQAQAVHAATNGNVQFVGHSLGGGLASASAIVTGGRATVFNAAGVNSRTVGGLTPAPGSITHFQSSFDGLQMLNSITPVKTYGEQVALGPAGWHPMGGVCQRVGC